MVRGESVPFEHTSLKTVNALDADEKKGCIMTGIHPRCGSSCDSLIHAVLCHLHGHVIRRLRFDGG